MRCSLITILVYNSTINSSLVSCRVVLKCAMSSRCQGQVVALVGPSGNGKSTATWIRCGAGFWVSYPSEIKMKFNQLNGV